MPLQKFFARPIWKTNDIIRHKQTGKPMLVLHVFIDSATLVADLEVKDTPLLPQVILSRDYDNWVKDLDMKCVRKGEEIEWELAPLL